MPAPSSWEGVTGHLEVRKERGRSGGGGGGGTCKSLPSNSIPSSNDLHT